MTTRSDGGDEPPSWAIGLELGGSPPPARPPSPAAESEPAKVFTPQKVRYLAKTRYPGADRYQAPPQVDIRKIKLRRADMTIRQMVLLATFFLAAAVVTTWAAVAVRQYDIRTGERGVDNALVALIVAAVAFAGLGAGLLTSAYQARRDAARRPKGKAQRRRQDG